MLNNEDVDIDKIIDDYTKPILNKYKEVKESI